MIDRFRAHATPGPSFVHASVAMQAVFATAARAAAHTAKVLITGESGVGKDVVARYIHAASARAARPFVAVNCAGLSETLLESELFGHVKGSFTGAYRDKPGKLQMAHTGTIFLDEVGEMTPRMQALLLRFLESGELQPVGADVASSVVDARVITATNRDLSALGQAGAFRMDLLYRIRVVQIHVPPLRERPDDVRVLAPHFLKRFASGRTFSEDVLRALETYPWPGNVRELQNIVEQLVSLSSETVIGLDDLPAHLPHLQAASYPVIDRRRHVADRLFQEITTGATSFWNDVYVRFMSRDLTRSDLRALISQGLAASGGNYRQMLDLFHIKPQDYKRLLNFLDRHDCRVEFRSYRPRFDETRRASA